MARNRMLNPEFWLDEELAMLSAHARLLYMGLWGICDDNNATLPNRPDWIKAQVFPYEEVDTRRLLTELSSKGKILLFVGDDLHEYWFIKNFFKHQKIDRPSKEKYPAFKPETSKHHSPLVEPSSSPRPEVKLSKEKLKEPMREESRVKEVQPRNKKKEPTPIVWAEYLQKMEDDPREHVQLIAYYFKKRGLTFDTDLEAATAISRHSRAASQVVRFGKAKVFAAIDACEKLARTKNIRYTIETILKELTR